MLQAFAPRLPRVLLAIFGLGFGCGGTVFGQTEPTKPAAQPGAAPAEKPTDDDDDVKVERFMDPNAKKTLGIFKPLTYTGVAMRVTGSPNDLTRVQNMASGVENEDPPFLKKYIEYFAVELSKRDNINALIAPPANLAPAQARGLERAVDALTRPIIDARANNKAVFLANYTRALFESSLPKLLDNNYLSRIDAMIVLGMAGGTSPVALDLYTTQLKIPDQIIWVKMWAARGLTNAAQSGRVNIDTNRALTAADALVTFLGSDAKLPYFAQFRALEALGSLRVASVNRPGLKLDVASIVAGYLTDPAARMETRAWAAWALGMMRVAPQVSPYNYSLVGSEIGALAGTLGTKIADQFNENSPDFDPDRDKVEANALTSLLMFQVVTAIAGEEGVSDSGLLRSVHPDAGSAKSFLTKLDDKVKAVSREAYELLRAGGTAQKTKRADLEAKVADLKSFLDQTKPKDRHLVPGGPLVATQPNGR